MHFDAAVIGKIRPGNQISQDSSLVRTDIGLFAVADGMGGRPGGREASSCAIDAIEKHLAEVMKNKEGINCSQELLTAYALANFDIIDCSQRNPQLSGMGTTLSTILLGAVTYIAHVGDSRIYHYRGNMLNQLTNDQNLTGELLRQKRITPEMAAKHPLRGMLFNALGDKNTQPPDIIDLQTASGDIFLLATDGVTEVVDVKQLAKHFEAFAGKTAEQLATGIIDLALPHASDDLTAIIVKVI